MNTQNESNTQTDLGRVLAKINDIAEKSADGDYIYRGEPECYKTVSSTLYRKLEELGVPSELIEDIQEAELMRAKRYIKETDDFEVLTEIQHFAGKTNLIDFTTDYHIALFFACDRAPFEDGRVILQDKNGTMGEWIEAPRNPEPESRPDVQKSIFVRPPNGFFKPADDDIVIIPQDLKPAILKYLESREPPISAEIIYPDLHGFVARQDLRWSAYIEFSKGNTCAEKARETRDSKEKDKNYRKAVDHFTKAIEIMPEFPEVYYNRGNIYNETSKYGDAIRDYTKAIDIQPDYAEAYTNRGITYRAKGEVDRAIQDYNTAIDLNPDFAEAYNNCGIANVQKGDLDAAIEDFSKAIALNPKLAEAYNNRGNAYKDKGEYDAAIEDFSTAIELKPADAAIYNIRGIAYAAKGEYDAAIEDFSTAIELKPADAAIYNIRGIAYAAKGEYDAAIEDFSTAIELKPADADTYRSRGIAYGDKGDLDAAIKDYTKAIDLKPADADAYYNRGTAYTKKGELDKTIEDFSTAIELKPDAALFYAHRGVVWLHLREWENAKVDLSTAQNMGIDIVGLFHKAYGSVAAFEAKYNVKMPEDIAALFSRDGNDTPKI